MHRRDDHRSSRRLHVPEALVFTILVTGGSGCGDHVRVPDARQPVADAGTVEVDGAVADAGPDAGVDAGVDAAAADAMPDTPLG